MRRRQIYAAAHIQTALERPTAEMLAHAVSSVGAPPLPEIPPGTCPTCRKHVGKGIAIHKRNCKG